jgi:hypothetical protein
MQIEKGWSTRLEGVTRKQSEMTKKGGYRISTKKSEQDLNHELKKIKSSSDVEDQ